MHDDVLDLYAQEGFTLPRFDKQATVEPFLRRVPAGATGKGMFPRRVLRELERRNLPTPTTQRFFPFQDVPLRTCMEINIAAAETLHPGLPVAEGLRRLGWLSLDTFADSLVGQVTLSTVSHNPHSIFDLTSKAMPLTTNVGSYHSYAIDSNTRRVEARDTYFFAEWFGVGMLEGVLRACDKQGLVAVRVMSPSDVDFIVHWE